MLIRVLIFFFLLNGILIAQPENPLTKNPEYSANKIEIIDIYNAYAGFYKSPDSIQFSLKASDSSGNLIPSLKNANFSIYVLPPGKKVDEKYKCDGIKLKYFINRYLFDVNALPPQNANGYYDLLVRLIYGKKIVDEERKSKAIFYSAPQIDVVLICDTSSSMIINDSQGYRKKALQYVLDYARRNGIFSKVAIVGFSTTAKVLCNLTSVHNKKLDEAVNSLTEDGNTNIGMALDLAFGELKKSSKETKKFVILLTDGENTVPYKDNHKPFVTAKYPIYAIGLTKGVNNEFLNMIAQKTGGEFYKAFESFKLQSIYDKVINRIASKKIIFDTDGVLDPGAKKEFKFGVDSQNNNLTITGSWDREGCDISIYDPKGNAIKSPDTIAKNYRFISIKKPFSGNWKIVVKNSSRAKTRFNLNAYFDSNLKIYLFPTIKEEYYREEPINITLSIQQGNFVPKDAKAYCEIFKPDNRKESIPLSRGGDEGIFTGYFINTTIPGEYEFRIKASGKNLKGEKFERIFIKNYFVSSNIQRSLIITPSSIDFKNTEKGKPYSHGFELVSSSDNAETISLYCQDPFVSITPSIFIVEPGRSKHFDANLLLPETFASKENKSFIIMESTKNSLAIPMRFISVPKKIMPDSFIRR